MEYFCIIYNNMGFYKLYIIISCPIRVYRMVYAVDKNAINIKMMIFKYLNITLYIPI